ncbi:hypothetical protein GCM10009827_019940 [Dactylosporangium maewongense]|uniref:Uncharacterized protein n=1 Tax=Dactylosporangium maewongense TaxID=634393 RepID=A0ABP4KRX9_9ACTN
MVRKERRLNLRLSFDRCARCQCEGSIPSAVTRDGVAQWQRRPREPKHKLNFSLQSEHSPFNTGSTDRRPRRRGYGFNSRSGLQARPDSSIAERDAFKLICDLKRAGVCNWAANRGPGMDTPRASPIPASAGAAAHPVQGRLGLVGVVDADRELATGEVEQERRP